MGKDGNIRIGCGFRSRVITEYLRHFYNLNLTDGQTAKLMNNGGTPLMKAEVIVPSGGVGNICICESGGVGDTKQATGGKFNTETFIIDISTPIFLLDKFKDFANPQITVNGAPGSFPWHANQYNENTGELIGFTPQDVIDKCGKRGAGLGAKINFNFKEKIDGFGVAAVRFVFIESQKSKIAQIIGTSNIPAELFAGSNLKSVSLPMQQQPQEQVQLSASTIGAAIAQKAKDIALYMSSKGFSYSSGGSQNVNTPIPGAGTTSQFNGIAFRIPNYGPSSGKGCDCSAFVHWVLHDLGIMGGIVLSQDYLAVSNRVSDGIENGKKIKLNNGYKAVLFEDVTQIRPGDILVRKDGTNRHARSRRRVYRCVATSRFRNNACLG